MALRWFVVTLFVVIGLIARPSALGLPDAAAAIDIQASCSPAPSDCSGWHHTDVIVSWTLNPRPEEGTQIISGCVTQTISTDTAGTPVWCEAAFGADQLRRTKVVAVDKTPPVVSAAAPARAADADGWYRQAVTVAFSGVDALSGVRSCTSTSYTGPDGAAALVPGSCTDVAGNTATTTFALPFDATGPVLTRAIPARKPDHDGWYNRPVAWHFRAADALSGLAECPAVILGADDAGPSSNVTGACRDKAGNVGTRVFATHYDATPPAAAQVLPQPRDHAVRLRIATGADAAALRISRVPGRGGHSRSTLYQGPPRGFTDRHVSNGHRYRYIVTSLDQAGNPARRRLAVVPGPRLLGPAPGATVTVPLQLRWTPVRGASYYNLQLFRDGRKLMSTWPTRASTRVGPRWRFAGRVRRLAPGRYRWYVWPGFGPRSERRFGRLVGSRSFVVAG